MTFQQEICSIKDLIQVEMLRGYRKEAWSQDFNRILDKLDKETK